MEAFSLLKYWRGSGAASADATSTAPTTVSNASGETAECEDEGNADDGPFFDMEFTVNGDERVESMANFTDLDDIHESDDESDDDCDCEKDGELKFTLSSSASSGDSIDPNISLSPPDDLFFKGRLVPLTEAHTNTHTRPVSKTTKLRVLMLKLKKSTKLSAAKGGDAEHKTKQPAKFFTVKFKVDEVPVLSMFTRDNSSKAAVTKQNTASEEEEKVLSKDVVNKYLKKVKPLYVRVSKLGFSGHLSLAATATPRVSEEVKSEAESTQLPNVKSLKQGISFPGKLRVVRKQLGKSKSASSTVTAAADSPPVLTLAKRRDDSLLQQQDGIQSAILHCKRSFKASRELEGKRGNENGSTAELSGASEIKPPICIIIRNVIE